MRSERRQRSYPVCVRFTPDDRAKVESAAKRYGVTVPELLRGPLNDLIEFGGHK